MIIAIAIHIVHLLHVYLRLRAEARSMNYKHTQSSARELASVHTYQVMLRGRSIEAAATTNSSLRKASRRSMPMPMLVKNL